MRGSWGKGDVCRLPTPQEDDERVDAEDLYRLVPEDFTAARDAAAKQARADGNRERAAALAALRRPTVSAWLLNHLVHTEPRLAEQLLQLGPGLAAAQAGGNAAALRTLGEQRRQLVGAVVGRAVELADAVAPPSAPDPTPTPKRIKSDQNGRRLAEAETAALDAAGRLDDAVRACRAAERRHGASALAEQESAAEVQRLTEQLAEAKVRHDDAADKASAAAKAARKAAAKVERAQDRAEQARAVLDALRRDD